MASIIPSLKFNARKANGQAYSGGKLYAYAAGTSTPKATYTTSTGSIQNSNPIILDSRGEADVYLGAGSYDFWLFDSNDNLVYTVYGIAGDSASSQTMGFCTNYDALRALSTTPSYSVVYVAGREIPNDGGQGTFLFNPLSNTSDDDGIVLTPSSAPSYGRWIRQFDGIIDVQWFTGGESGDNSVSIQNCASSCLSLGYDTIWFSETNYTVNSNVSINSSINVKVDGLIDGTGHLNILGKFDAGIKQVFSSTLSASIATTESIKPQWWGAVGDGATDDKVAFDKSTICAYNSGNKIVVPKKIYYLSSWNLNGLAQGLLIEGEGPQTQLKFGSSLSYGLRIDGGCRKVIMRDLTLNFPNATVYDCFQLGTSAGSSQAYECSFHNITMTGNSGSNLQRGLVVEQSYINQFYNCQILSFGTNIVFKSEANSNNFYGCSIRAQSSNHVRLIDAQSGQENTFYGGDIENAYSWVKNTGCKGLIFNGVYFESSNSVAIYLEDGYTEFVDCFLSEARAYVYEGGKCSFKGNRILKTGTSYFLYFIQYAILTFQAGGYTSFIASDIGKTITGSLGGSGEIVSYDNATRTALVIPTADFTNGGTTAGTTGGGTLDVSTGYAQDTPMVIPYFVADGNWMEYTTPGSTTTGLFTRGFTTGLQSWKWDASGPNTASISNYCHVNQERIFDVNDSTLKTLILSNASGLRLAGPVDANSGTSRFSRISLTQTTGTAPMDVASTTVVTNLNADLLDGLDGSRYAQQSTLSSTVTSGTNWYRVATNGTVSVGGTGGNRCGAIFDVYDSTGGQHAIARFYAACLFGNQPTLILLHNNAYTSRRLTKIRLVYSTSVGSGEGVALDLEITGGSSEDLKVVMLENGATTGWGLSDLSVASVPGGSYTTMELELSNPVFAMSMDGLANAFQIRRNGRIASAQVPTATVPAQRHSALYKIASVNLNSAATDTGTFTGLPSKYRVIRLTVFDASTSLTTATIDLRTAASGGGTAIVAAFAPTACTAASKFVDATLAVTADYQTAGTLYLRNVTAQGSAATASMLLEIEDLS